MTATPPEPPTLARKVAALAGVIRDMETTDYPPQPEFGAGEFANLHRLAGEARIQRMVVEVLPEPLCRLLDEYAALQQLRLDVEGFWCAPGEHIVPGEDEYAWDGSSTSPAPTHRTCRECMENA